MKIIKVNYITVSEKSVRFRTAALATKNIITFLYFLHVRVKTSDGNTVKSNRIVHSNCHCFFQRHQWHRQTHMKTAAVAPSSFSINSVASIDVYFFIAESYRSGSVTNKAILKKETKKMYLSNVY